MTNILKTALDVKILTTSRVRLNVQGEHLFSLAGMDFPDLAPSPADQPRGDKPKDAIQSASYALSQHPERSLGQDAMQCSAIRLFLTCARQSQPGFELTADNLTHVVRICHMVEGMPLAILLAASWMEMLSPAEIAAETDQGLDFLETDLRDVPARQRSVRAVFDHSWHLLSEREREVFQALSIFRGGFTRRAARQVIGGSLRELRSLVNKSLMHRTSTGRYEVHELLRQYAAEKLDASPAAGRAAHDRHAAYYAAALQHHEANLKGSRPQVALAEIDAESENMRLAWTWAAGRGQVELLEQAMDGLLFFYLWRRRYREGEAVCRLAEEKLAPLADADGLRVLTKILIWRSSFSWRLGRTEDANQLLQKSLALLDRPELAGQDTRPQKASALLQMGHIAFDCNRRVARQSYEQSLALYRALDDRWGMANALSGLSWAVWSGGAYSKAKQLFEESLAIRQSLSDRRGIVDSLAGLSFMVFFQGQFEEADRLMRASVAVLQEMGVQTDIQNELLDTDEIQFTQEEYAEAHALYRERVGFYSDLGISHSLAPTYSTFGFIEKHLGQYKGARVRAQAGLALAREAGWQQEAALCLQVLGEVSLAEGIYAEAHEYLRESVAILRENRQIELSDALAVLGYALRGLGQLPQAERHLVEALQTATEIRTIFPLVTALPVIALLLADQGEKERAVELYALAARYPRVANSHWFDDIVGQHIAAVAATLPPDMVEAARARGQTRDLEATVAELLAELEGR